MMMFDDGMGRPCHCPFCRMLTPLAMLVALIGVVVILCAL